MMIARGSGSALVAAGLALAACGDNAAGPDGGAPADGGGDASPFGCHARGDYLEAHDATNDLFAATGTAETTLATTAPGVRFTIGGCLDPGFATASSGDVDGFGFALGGDAPSFLTARLTSPAGEVVDGAQVVLIDATGEAITGARAAGGTATLAPRRSPPGAYRLVVRNPDTAAPRDHVVTYQVEVATFTCDPPATATATEQGDGDGTGNDVLAVTTVTQPNASPLGAGSAEDGGGAGPGDVVRLDGELAVRASSGDDYLDRDTWRVALTGDARRVVVAIDWAQSGDESDDVDGLVLPAGQPDALGGAGIGVDRPEAFGGVVAPGDAWLWVGARVGAAPRVTPLPYAITACVFD